VTTTRTASGVVVEHAGGGDGIPLVLVHGWSGDRGDWRAQFDALAIERPVVMLDLPGHGETPLGDRRPDVPALAGAVIEVIDHLGLDEVVLAGHSMGGWVVLTAADRLGRRVRGLVGADTFKTIGIAPSAEQVAAAGRALHEDFAGFVDASCASWFLPDADPALRAKVRDRALAGDRAALTAIGASASRHTRDHGLELARRMPCGLIAISAAGVREATLADYGRASELGVRGLRARFVDGVGHYLMIERSDTYTGLLRHAIDELLSDARRPA
jgi:pimeloyl-ACP methyl ester carboxylesterase